MTWYQTQMDLFEKIQMGLDETFWFGWTLQGVFKIHRRCYQCKEVESEVGQAVSTSLGGSQPFVTDRSWSGTMNLSRVGPQKRCEDGTNKNIQKQGMIGTVHSCLLTVDTAPLIFVSLFTANMSEHVGAGAVQPVQPNSPAPQKVCWKMFSYFIFEMSIFFTEMLWYSKLSQDWLWFYCLLSGTSISLGQSHARLRHHWQLHLD
jgi:hypothetical protein